MDDGMLIELVQKYTFLYDRSHKDFKNKICRENAWSTIGEILGYTADEVEGRWAGLRNRYSSEKRKIKCIPSGSGAITDWRFFKMLSFLDPFIVNRRTQTNVKVFENKENVWETPILLDKSSQDLPSQSIDDNSADNSELEQASCSSVGLPPKDNEIKNKRSAEESSTSRKRRKTNNLQECISDAFSKLETFMSSEQETETENTLFAKSLAFSLERLSTRKKQASAKREILEILEKYESD